MNQAFVERLMAIPLPAKLERKVNEITEKLAESIKDDPFEKVQDAVEQFAPDAAHAVVHSDEWREGETRYMQSVWYGVKVGVILTTIGDRLDELATDPKALSTFLMRC